MPAPITQELLLKGYDTPALNIIPEVKSNEKEWIPDGSDKVIKDSYLKLEKIRQRLCDSYNQEFLSTLIRQAVDKKSRYKPVNHKKLQVGDIVLIKTEHVKAFKYPMGVVTKTFENDLGEVTSAIVKKGTTKEKVKRHVSSLIPYLTGITEDENLRNVREKDSTNSEEKVDYKSRERTLAAVKSDEKTRNMLSQDQE